jgi:hypothetical protein
MRNKLNHIEEIENYLEGRLSAQDRAVFENRVMNNEGLREEVNIQRQIADRIRTNAFKSELAAFHLAYTAPAKKFAWKTILLNSFIGLACLGSATAAVIYVSTLGTKKQEVKQVAQIIPAQKQEAPVRVETVVEPLSEPAYENETRGMVPSAITSKKWNKIIPVYSIDQSLNVPINTDIDNRYTDLSPVFTRTQFDAEKGTDTLIMTGSQSFVHFPGGILIDRNGKKVTGEVEFRYREFKDPAQMAFSKTSSVWSDNGKKYNLQTAGMFEVRVYKGNEEVFVEDGKSFKIDYKLKQDKADSTYFLAKNTSDEWIKIKKVELQQNSVPIVSKRTKLNMRARQDKGEALGKILVKVYDAQTGVVIDIASVVPVVVGKPTTDYYVANKADSSYRPLVLHPGDYDLIAAAAGYRKMKIKGIKVIKDRVSLVKVKLMPHKRDQNVWRKSNEGYALLDTNKVQYTVDGSKSQQRADKDINVNTASASSAYKATRIYLFKTGASYVIKDSVTFAEGEVGKKKRKKKDGAYTSVGEWKLANSPSRNENSGNVKEGLKCTTTGTFYCAKVTSSKEELHVKATYLDEKGQLINNVKALCMIDRKTGNAMDLSLDEVIKSKNEKIILLLTRDNKLYGMNEKEYKAAMELKTGGQTLKMKRINISGYDQLGNWLTEN